MNLIDSKQGRTRLSGVDMDKQYRRHTRFLTKTKMTAARDYYNVVSSTGHNPLPLTPWKVEAGFELLVQRGGSSAQRRARAWLVALRALPPDYRHQIGIDEMPDFELRE